MAKTELQLWARATVDAEELIFRAFFNWLELMIIGTVTMPVLPFLLMLGVAPKIVTAVIHSS